MRRDTRSKLKVKNQDLEPVGGRQESLSCDEVRVIDRQLDGPRSWRPESKSDAIKAPISCLVVPFVVSLSLALGMPEFTF